MLKWLVSMVMVLCLCGPVYGEMVTVTWEEPAVTGTWDNIIGFALRINNDTVINVPGKDVREWTGDVPLTQRVNIFDMRAAEETRISGWSYPAYYVIPEDVPPPQKVKVKR